MKKKLLAIYLLFFTLIASAQTGSVIDGTITTGGVTRTYKLYVPAMYDGSSPVPIIFNFHGLGSTSGQQLVYGDFRKIADTANFIIVLPQGLQVDFVIFKQNAFDVFNNLDKAEADLNFTSDLIDKLKGEYNINMGRIYSTGMSNGGFMSHEIACRLSQRFAAIASVAGTMTPAHFTACNGTTHPMPVMQIHGTSDATVKYDGTPGSSFINFTHVDTIVKHWVNFNNCNTTPTNIKGDTLPDISVSADTTRAVHFVYESGDAGSTVELYKVIGGSHSWPGNLSTAIGTNQDFNASKEIWRFFNQHKSFVGIEEESKNNFDFAVYPNPTAGDFSISINNNYASKLTITIVDVLGKEVYSSTKSNLGSNYFTTLNLNSIDSGIYFININSDSNSKTQKIVIQ